MDATRNDDTIIVNINVTPRSSFQVLMSTLVASFVESSKAGLRMLSVYLLFFDQTAECSIEAPATPVAESIARSRVTESHSDTMTPNLQHHRTPVQLSRQSHSSKHESERAAC